MSQLLPSTQAADLQRGLVDFLTTTFALADADARLALEDFLRHETEGIFKGPYLRLRLPFRPAEPGWERHLEWTPGGFVPYGHQAEAFARLTSRPSTSCKALIATSERRKGDCRSDPRCRSARSHSFGCRGAARRVPG